MNFFSLILLSLFLLLHNSFPAQEPIRTWTSSDGRTLEAKFVEMVGDNSVKIENVAGKEFTLPKSRISAADWKYVEKIVVELKEKQAQEELFRLPKSLSGKGCVIIASLKGNVEVFDNPAEEGSFGGSYINGKYLEPREAKGRKPKVGETIETGGVIITKANSQAVLLLTNGTLATLNENSRVVLENLWQTPFEPSSTKVSDLKEEPSVSRTSMELGLGELIVDVKKLNKDSSFLVHSLLGQAGIRGTQFRFSSKNSGTTLSVTEGLVEYLDPKRKIFKVGRENSVTTQADKSSKPGRLDQNEKVRINSVISKASQSSASYDLKKLSDASQKSSQQKKTFIVRSAKNLEMIWCPPGSYLMGNDSRTNTVILTKGFYLGKYEVTQGQYERVMGKDQYERVMGKFSNFLNPQRQKRGAEFPIELISWYEAMAFAARLNKTEWLPRGWSFSLPTSAEWEYACRAGTTTEYSWGDDLDLKFANYSLVKNGGTPKAVGMYRPNRWGFYDMHGNVREWCANDWRFIPSERPLVDPGGNQPLSTVRILRGGTYTSGYDGKGLGSGDMMRMTTGTILYSGIRLYLGPAR